ncbi:MAG: pyridoxal-phosphate dependent enzyme [Bdellovibrio sp.]
MISPLNVIEINDTYFNLENGNRIFTTFEGENPGGSVKDHMVLGELKHLLQQNVLKKGDIISEVSSGSTAISLAYYCSLFGLKCILFLPDTAAWKLLFHLQKLGAEVHTEDPQFIYSTYDSFSTSHPHIYRFSQLFDKSKQRHYNDFGRQILQVLGSVDAIIGGVGTGHSLLGTAQGLGTLNIISAEPESSFRVPGIRNTEFERYGEKDPCQGTEFTERIVIPKLQLFKENIIYTSEGPVHISTSFKVVLAATQIFLLNKSKMKIFVLGASLRKSKGSSNCITKI